jgi:hypothetical protein
MGRWREAAVLSRMLPGGIFHGDWKPRPGLLFLLRVGGFVYVPLSESGAHQSMPGLRVSCSA